MANPQKENGYTAIANELFQALCRIRIPGEARQVIDVVFRKTYGFNKSEDAISLSQFQAATLMRKPDVCRAINHALTMRIISKKANPLANIYRINKDFDTWVPLAKKRRGYAKKQIMISKKANNHSQKSDIQKTVTKDTLTKDSVERPDAGIVAIIDAFKDVNPAYAKWFANKTQRAAAQRLIEQHGLDHVLAVIAILNQTNAMPYVPTVTTPDQLENKWAALEATLKRKKTEHAAKKRSVIL